MVAAWVATVAIVAAGTLPAIAIIWRGAPGTDPVLARFAYDIQTLATYAITSTAALVSIGALCVAIWRTGVLPRWLSVLGAAEIAVNVAELSGLSSPHGALVGGYAFGTGPLLWIVWFAAASACMTLKTYPSQERSEARDPHSGSPATDAHRGHGRVREICPARPGRIVRMDPRRSPVPAGSQPLPDGNPESLILPSHRLRRRTRSWVIQRSICGTVAEWERRSASPPCRRWSLSRSPGAAA
jgi:hypothetical protein